MRPLQYGRRAKVERVQELVAPRLEPHDANQLELKLGYVVKPGDRHQHYQIETYMFIPKTLGIDRHSYNSSRFYADTAAFLRLRTPPVSLESLATVGKANRWFDQLVSGLKGRELSSARGVQRLARRIKILGCIYRSALHDDARTLRQQLASAPAPDPLAEGRMQETTARRLRRLARNITRALRRLRELDEVCLARGFGDVICDSWSAVDEYVTLIVEDISKEVIIALDNRTARSPVVHPDLINARETLVKIAVDAHQYRRGRGYRSQLIAGESNEELPHWRRTIKRIVFSALYLDVRHEEVGRLAYDLVGAAAAMIAMAFAITVSLLAQLELDIFSGTFVAIMIVSYMIKDRLKDWGKRYGGKHIGRFLPDTIIRVHDTEGDRVLGQCREQFNMLKISQVDDEILKSRRSRRASSIERLGKPEVVIRYLKDITLYSQPLRDELAGLEGLHDIIRFNLGHLRDRMDAPREDHQLIDPSTGEILVIPCARVYHVNIILRTTAGRGKTAKSNVERIRVVMDQRGIKRVEYLDRRGKPVVCNHDDASPDQDLSNLSFPAALRATIEGDTSS